MFASVLWEVTLVILRFLAKLVHRHAQCAITQRVALPAFLGTLLATNMLILFASNVQTIWLIAILAIALVVALYAMRDSHY